MFVFVRFTLGTWVATLVDMRNVSRDKVVIVKDKIINMDTIKILEQLGYKVIMLVK